jgi:hypothetical protein
MEILKNAGDLGGRQNIHVYCKPIKILSDIEFPLRALFAVLGLLFLFDCNARGRTAKIRKPFST